MRAVVLTKFGSPDVLQLQEVAKPVPQDNEVLIRIHATTVSAGDCQLRSLSLPLVYRIPLFIGVSLLRRFRSRPLVLGQEAAGEIDAVGTDVRRFRPGDQVFAWTGIGFGGYAEYTCLPETGVIAIKPSAMSYEEAAPLAVGGLEAAYFMRKGHIQRGEKILIIGAGGSIGTFAVQLAKTFGAYVTGVDSAGKLDLLRTLGADEVIDYAHDAFSTRRETYNVIFDVIGKSSFSRSIRMLRPNGRYLLGNPPLSHQVLGRWTARRDNKHVIPWASRTRSEYAEDARFLTELIEAGKLHTVIDRRYPLEQTAEAHRYVETGQKRGNIVITVDQSTR